MTTPTPTPTPTLTWAERREALKADGITNPELLEIARRATAPERIEARQAEVARLLGLAEGDGLAPSDDPDPEGTYRAAAPSGLVAALDCLGAAGPYGAGGPGGCSVRVPALASIPRHQAQSGPAWDAAVAAHSWPAIHGDVDEAGDVGLAPTATELAEGSPHYAWIEPPDGLEPQWWAPLTDWLSALAHRVVIEHVAPGTGRAPSPPEVGVDREHTHLLRLEISLATANRLAEFTRLEIIRRRIVRLRLDVSEAMTHVSMMETAPSQGHIDILRKNRDIVRYAASGIAEGDLEAALHEATDGLEWIVAARTALDAPRTADHTAYGPKGD